MKKRNRWISLLLAAGLMLSLMTPAAADVMTLGVHFSGVVEQPDGTSLQIPLEGSFRVTQGGLDAGVIQAGVTTVTLTGRDPVTLTPMAETVDAGWDLSGLRVTLPMKDGGNVTVPIQARRLQTGSGEKDAAAGKTGAENAAGAAGAKPSPAASDAPAAEPAQSASPVRTAAPADTAGPAASDGGSKPTAVTGNAAVPAATPAPTAAPEVKVLTASADTAAFHLKVFYDSNSNGGCSIYEKGVAGIQVYLVSEAGEIVTGGQTGSDGEILLPGLKPGSYRVRVSLPEEWGFNRKSKDTGLDCSIMTFSEEGVQDSEPITVRAGETAERGIGLLKGVVVDGVCWLDENANGIMEAGEPKIAGARVTLEGQKNGLKFEAVSDADGYWRIYRLRAGFYDFTGYAPEGMMFTRYSKTGGKNRSVFTAEGKTKSTKTLDLNDGKDQPDQNIGFAWTASVSGIAFLDANYNGLYDEGEKPLAGVKVTAIKQLKDEEISVAHTGEDGRYTLSGLRGNTYKIRAVLPDDGSNFTRTVDDPEGNHFVPRTGRRENFWKDFELKDGEKRTVNVGAVYFGSVSGTVYMDDDFSAGMNGKEKTVQGISVTLLDENGTAVDTKQTSAKGTYTFTDLTPGQYSLRMTAKAGYAFTRTGDGNVMLNLNGGEGYSLPFEVPLGESVTGMDAGMIKPGTVRGTVFADENDNGRREAGEAGLEGTRVRLMSEEGEAFSATISATGEFLFDAVMPGRYYLEYLLPEEAVFAREGGDSAITAQGEDSRLGRGEWFDFRTAEVKDAPLCGGLTLGKISGLFFRDPDGSGTREAGEGPLAGLRVTLTPERAELESITVETGADGSFEMTELRPGSWKLTVALPEGMVTTRTAGVTLPVQPGRTEQENELKIAMGQRWTEQEIGGAAPAAIRGRAWLDENNDGRTGAEERALQGLKIVITDAETGEVFDTLTTDRKGEFAHEGMVPGSYVLSYEMKAEEDAPKGGDNVFRKDGKRMATEEIRLREGDLREDLTLGLIRYTAMGGEVWIDRGQGAEPLPEARISLADGEGEVLQTAVTDGDGTWSFTGLMPGTYRIEAELPEGTVAAEPDDERLDTGLISILEETDGRRGRSDLIELEMGEDQTRLDIGSVLPGTIGDFCWLDLNGNGWQDGGELGIPHVKVELIRNGEAVAETETDQYGLYFFREVYPAVYTLRVTAPGEVKPTRKKTDIPLIVSSLNQTEGETAETDAFAVASDSTDFNIDLGYALRTSGAYPPGYGEQETMDWSRAYEDHSGE